MAKDWKEELRDAVREACREAERIEREQMEKLAAETEGR